jgi:hypothetical protein
MQTWAVNIGNFSTPNIHRPSRDRQRAKMNPTTKSTNSVVDPIIGTDASSATLPSSSFSHADEWERRFDEAVEHYVREQQAGLHQRARIARRAAQATVEATRYELRAYGIAQLAKPRTQARLADFNAHQITEMVASLRRMQARYPAITDELITAIEELMDKGTAKAIAAIKRLRGERPSEAPPLSPAMPATPPSGSSATQEPPPSNNGNGCAEEMDTANPQPEFDLDELRRTASHIIVNPNILDLFAQDLGKVIAGEATNGKLLYLVATSRLFDKTMNAAIKGTSAGGQSPRLASPRTAGSRRRRPDRRRHCSRLRTGAQADECHHRRRLRRGRQCGADRNHRGGYWRHGRHG